MAVSELTLKYAGRIYLNNGTQDGKVKTVTVSLPTLDKDEYDAQKVMNVVDAAEAIFSKSIYEVQVVKTTRLMND